MSVYTHICACVCAWIYGVCISIIINIYVNMYVHSCKYVYIKSWIMRLSYGRDYLYLTVKETKSQLGCNFSEEQKLEPWYVWFRSSHTPSCINL